MDLFLQFMLGGLTVGAMYAFVALGFVLLYNVSGIINFAQGEFVMLGGMATFGFLSVGLPLPLAIPLALATAVAVGIVLMGLSTMMLRKSTVLEVIVMTIAAAVVIRGVVEILLGKDPYSIPGIGSGAPIMVLGASILPQALWLLGITLVVLAVVAWFFRATLAGKAILAVAYNKMTAQMVGIRVNGAIMAGFCIAALLGGLAGVLIAPISLTSFDSGLMIGLKGIMAAILGGMGSVVGAVVGGFLLGIAEAMTAGYITSRYKDAIPFLFVLAVFMLRPNGLLGEPGEDRV